MEYNNAAVMQLSTSQSLYDAFNSFIFDPDTKVLGKLAARILLAEQTRKVPGDIVECGVFKGSGMASWLKIKKLLFPNAVKKVIGFDFFDTQSLLAALSGKDQDRMKELFEQRNYQHDEQGEQVVKNYLETAGFGAADFELVKGDIGKSAPKFTEERPGFKISLLYIDLDVEEATYQALEALWPRLSRGGLVVFDEYAWHQWSEAKGADKFFADKQEQIQVLEFLGPTAYVIKN